MRDLVSTAIAAVLRLVPPRCRVVASLLLLVSTISACAAPDAVPNGGDAGPGAPTAAEAVPGDGSAEGDAETGAPEGAGKGPGDGLSVPTAMDEADEEAALATEVAQDLDALQALIVDAWSRREDELVIAVMGDPFQLGLWRSEGSSAPPRDAIVQLGLYYPGDAPVRILDPQPDLTAMLDGSDPNTFWGPEVEVLRNVVTSGWGPDGTGQAILVLARHPDGYPYFHGALIAPLGFD